VEPTDFKSGVIRPIECISAGWELLRGQYLLMVGMSFVGIFLGSLAPMAILLGPMMCGLYLSLFARMRGERVEFGWLFKGFDHFVDSLVATLLQMVPMVVVAVPAFMGCGACFVLAGALAGRRGGAALPVGLLFGGIAMLVLFMLVLTVVVGALFLFTYPLIVDRKLSGLEACKASLRAARANLKGAIALVLLTHLMGLAGLLVCYVGAFFTAPIGLAAIAVAYRRVFPAEG
jgi:hypothetical protein